MQIHGLNKTTLLDYPEHVAATVFTGGCNFRCPFCHNKDLVLNPMSQPTLDEQEVLAFLKKRKGILTGVCVTGGEPTLQTDLKQFLEKVKEIGLKIKLDTNGYHPEILNDLIESGLVDYVAMDVKSSKGGYAKTAGFPCGEEPKNASFTLPEAQFRLGNIEESIRILMEEHIPYEFRTTVVKELHTKEVMQEIGEWLQGCQAYFLQSYEESEHVIKPGFHPCTKEELLAYKKLLENYIKNVALRGVE